jgi:hypothetical protein
VSLGAADRRSRSFAKSCLEMLLRTSPPLREGGLILYDFGGRYRCGPHSEIFFCRAGFSGRLSTARAEFRRRIKGARRAQTPTRPIIFRRGREGLQKFGLRLPRPAGQQHKLFREFQKIFSWLRPRSEDQEVWAPSITDRWPKTMPAWLAKNLSRNSPGGSVDRRDI